MKFNIWNTFSDNRGFTLTEVMVVTAIIGVVSASIIVNFPRARIDLSQSANVILSTIRFAQSQTISSAQYNNYLPCGYGIHYIDSTHYAIYVGPSATSNNCTTVNKNYQSGQDTIISTQTLNERVQFMATFNDIFFEPPDPKTYLNNNASLNQSPIAITIGKTGTTCPQNCKTINVYSSGKIE